MSTAELLGSSQTSPTAETPLEPPALEVARRLADGAGLWPIGHAIGIENLRAILADARQRVRDSHRQQAKAVGMEDTVGKDGDEMGDINVQGDTHITIAAPSQPQAASPNAPASNPPAQNTAGIGAAPPPTKTPAQDIPAVVKRDAGWAKTFGIPILCGLLGAGGVGGGMAIYNWFNKAAPVVNQLESDYLLHSHVSDNPQ